MRAVEYFAESIITETYNMLPELFPSNKDLIGDKDEFKAVRCTRYAEFNFLIDKVKIGKLQCANESDFKVLMGYKANPAIPHGDYYLATSSETFYGIADNGVMPYLGCP